MVAMIEINLVPEQVRKKRRSLASAAVSRSVPTAAGMGLVAGFLVFLAIASLGLQLFIGERIKTRNSLKQEMDSLGGAKTNVDTLIKDVREAQGRVKNFEEVFGGKKVAWAPKLNEISESLPRGVWLTKVALEDNTLVIQGSSVSKLRTEMSDVHSFTANLKSSKKFMTDFSNIEVGLIKTRTIESLPVAEFTIKADLRK
mgnify:CR=1 FL=1